MDQHKFSCSIFYPSKLKFKFLSECLFPFVHKNKELIKYFHYYDSYIMGENIRIMFQLNTEKKIIDFGTSLDQALSSYLEAHPAENIVDNDKYNYGLFFQDFPLNSIQYNLFDYDFELDENHYHASISYLMLDLFEEFESDIWDNSIQILFEAYLIFAKIFGFSKSDLLILFEVLIPIQNQKIKNNHLTRILENSSDIYKGNEDYFQSIIYLLEDQTDPNFEDDFEIWQNNLTDRMKSFIKKNKTGFNKTQMHVFIYNSFTVKFHWETMVIVSNLIRFSLSDTSYFIEE
jgi:hypothetical protein